ncbi:hypothetical protein CAEBREN_21066 [Caenorhabditis brenneri]|uniref:F-box associated domain-containing protein n=1 Tax=Caenorhabditis brenneri TaxID=135651 RepID=G0MLX7_CAEBE|nr:hypothetical protein CAEBREN_21066 [Caenorhabditis brenneri]
MNYKSFFLLSLCSIRTEKLLEHHLRKGVRSIGYYFSSKGIQVLVESPDGSRELIIVVKAGDKPLHSYLISNTGIGSFQRLVKFCKDEDDLITIQYPIRLPNYEKPVKQGIIEQVTALFTRSSPTVHLEIQIDDRLGELVPIRGVQSTRLSGNQIETKVLEELFTNFPDQKDAVVLPKLIGELSKDSKLFELESLCIFNAFLHAVPILEQSNHRELQVYDAIIGEANVNSVVRKWIENEAYQNLEVMRISSRSSLGPRMNQENHTPWSLEPYMFEYESRFLSGSRSVDCRQYHQIQRTSDGKMAAFRIRKYSFELYVWNRSRDQFVEMVH